MSRDHRNGSAGMADAPFDGRERVILSVLRRLETLTAGLRPLAEASAEITALLTELDRCHDDLARVVGIDPAA
jgi:hypothetical protein